MTTHELKTLEETAMIRIHEPCHSVRIQYYPDKKDCLIGWDVTPGAETFWLDRDELERALQIVQLYPKAMIEKEGKTSNEN